jgi:hypothetical protein
MDKTRLAAMINGMCHCLDCEHACDKIGSCRELITIYTNKLIINYNIFLAIYIYNVIRDNVVNVS